MAALEHWLPLFHERPQTIFDLLPEARVILDPEVEERRDAWLEQIAEAYQHHSAIATASRLAHPGQLQPLPPDRLYLDAGDEVGRRTADPAGRDGNAAPANRGDRRAPGRAAGVRSGAA
jgi:transcription-repair coupling factor (superfamily II helicase)